MHRMLPSQYLLPEAELPRIKYLNYPPRPRVHKDGNSRGSPFLAATQKSDTEGLIGPHR